MSTMSMTMPAARRSADVECGGGVSKYVSTKYAYLLKDYFGARGYLASGDK